MRSLAAAVVNLGCRVNRVELDAIAEQLRLSGVRLSVEDDASVVVVNTCAVTGEAEAKCRKAVRRALSMPNRPYVVATGCATALFASEFCELGERVVVEPNKQRAAEVALELLEGLGFVPGAPIDEAHSVTPTGRARPGVKVQDGCDNRCSYCIVWKARGPARSVAPERVLQMVNDQVARGAHEVVLTGINLGRYEALDAHGVRVGLAELLDLMLSKTDVGRLRLSSVEPPETTDDVLRVMGESGGRVAPFLHLPLQSGCDHTLREMRRTYESALYRHVVERARELVPGLGLACDFIVGFPGETDEHFEDSLAFCEQMRFSHMHVFRYSQRPGTPAAERPDQVDPQTKSERAERATRLSREMRLADSERRVGSDSLVLVERPGRGSDGALFQVLVDESYPVGSLVQVQVKAVTPDGFLDGR